MAVPGLLTAVVVLLPRIAAGVEAAPAPQIVSARLSASSTPKGAERAVDATVRTAWCPARSDERGEWVVRFQQPVTIRSLSIYVGRMDPTRMSADDYQPAPIAVAWDSGEAMLDPTENGQNALEVLQAAGQSTMSLSFRLAPAPGRDRCLSEIDLELEQGPWVYGLSQAALDELPKAVELLTQAFRTCDADALARHAAFPLPVRRLQGEHGTLARLFAPRARAYPHVRALARDCRWLVIPSEDEQQRRPHVSGSVAPSTVRVWANYQAGVRYWRLSWNGHRWRLTGIDSSEFE